MRTVASLATVVLLGGLLFSATAAKKTSSKVMTTPDFAYPKTVVKNASANLEKSVANGDWAAAVEAAIQSVTANNLISRENAISGLNRLDSLTHVAPARWKPAFRLIKADMLNAMYNSFRWEADSRKLPLDSIPDNPYDWSKDIFANKIYSICNDILDSRDNDATPLKEWSLFLSDTSEASKAGFTVDEFTTRLCFELLNVYSDETKDVIPFFKGAATPGTPAQKCSALRDHAIDILIEKTSALGQSLFLANALVSKSETLAYSQRMKFMLSALDNVKGTEGEQQILINLRDFAGNFRNDNIQSAFPYTRDEFLKMLEKSVKDFPQGIYSNSLRNIINEITRPNAEIEFSSQYLTSAQVTMDVNLSNCNQCWLLVYDYSPYVNSSKSPRTKAMAATCKMVKAVKATAEGTIPFNTKTTVDIGKLPAGTYVVVPSTSADSKGIFPSILNDSWRNTFTLSDISIMTLKCPDATTKIFVVDGTDCKPIEGAKVKVFSRPNYSSDRKLIETLTTDKNGCITVSETNFEIEASYNGSVWNNRMRMHNSSQKPDTLTRNNIKILADRSIYHPGDSIKAAIVAYSTKEACMKTLRDINVETRLIDANGREVETRTVKTDQYGRAVSEFLIPLKGLLGSWRLSAADENGKILGSSYFEVADYVAPTFFITAEHSEEDVNPGDVVKIKGQVLTYSGMPLADAVVKYSVSYTPPMRWFVYSNATYDSSVKTDEAGKYEISLPTDNLKDTQFERGIFHVKLSAISPAGESQSGPTEKFALGREYNIYSPDGGKYFEISQGVPEIKFKVYDMLGRNVIKKLRYTLVNKATGVTAASGSFMSPTLALSDSAFASAAYDLKVSLDEDPKVESELCIVLWRKTDKKAPEGVKLWVPEYKIVAESGQKSVNATVGSGIPDRWIPAVVTSANRLIDVKWIHVEKDNVCIPVDVPADNFTTMVDLGYLSDLEVERRCITVSSAASEDRLNVRTETFRDKISAGDEEHWSFRFSRNFGSASGIPVLAVMTDAALNSIAPFSWNFSPSANVRNNFYFFDPYYGANKLSSSFILKTTKYLSSKHIFFPQLNDYGQGWGIGNFLYVHEQVMLTSAADFGASNGMVRSVMRNSAKMAAVSAMKVETDGLIMEDSAEETAVEEETDAEAPEAVYVTGAGGLETEQELLRPAECPVAFFMPWLSTDADGIVNIDFTVPNFNTTWALQVIGYDDELRTAKIALETVASKPVMVSTHAPRFVRTGDCIELTATVFNNTDADASPICRIELVDLITGKTVASESFKPLTVKAEGNLLITMKWDVPADLSSVGFRAYAEMNGHRDGEQALLPVIPASSPVVDSTPFWMAPGQKDMEIKLPKFKTSDQVTLQYCDNPAWYCLTALPDIINIDSKSVTALMKALYGNATAYHLVSANPNLKKGLTTLLSDSNSGFAAIKSNLEKDGNLKIVDLANSPWVNNAESETLRMSRLSTLLDDGDARNAISALLNDVRNLQSTDGGWSWCPEMKSSSFISQSVLSYFAMLSKGGALSACEGAESMIKSGIRYVDSEIVKDYKKYHKKGESLSYLLDWLYIRSSFPTSLIPTGGSSNEIKTISTKAENDIASEWKDLSIGAKAKAAMVLWRAGKHRTASEIMESLRQYASESPEKGMWFDNLNSGWGGISSLLTTTLVLEAYAEIQPKDKNIDALRQWLVLGRQYQDWGRYSSTAETVNAILTSGSDWTPAEPSVTPEFFLKGKRIEIPETAALTGAFTLNLKAEDASKKTLRISRSCESPAWGGVISQYESPILDVKPAEVPELSIRKNVVALVEGENGETIAKENIILEKGMKVRVTLFITVGRDMDYVALTDERSACLEPTDQLSGYNRSDGVGFYREVRNASTNIFFEWLPKGNHVISYDCTVSQEGDFSCGIATIQSQYSPVTVAHTAGSVLHVR